MENSKLPVIKNNSLPAKIKDYLSTRSGKSKALAGLTALSIAGIATSFAIPISVASSFVALSSLAGFSYGGLKLVKNTVLHSYKDLAFVIKNKQDSIKISQDLSRLDLMKHLIGKSKSEKLAFMQLQAIVGLSKIDSLPTEFQNKKIETDTHGIVISTFEKLNKLGIIEDFSRTPKLNLSRSA